MSWLHSLIEANIYLAVFYLCYCLFLNLDTHYLLGRVYLIFSCIIAFFIPLTQVSVLKPAEQVQLQQVVYAANLNPAYTVSVEPAAPIQQFTIEDALLYVYIAGVAIAFCILMYRLYKLYILTRNKKSQYQHKYKIIILDDENTAFSFFNYLFIGSNLPQADTIIAHELVHIRQKHSVDIIFLEMVKIINWFNPFVYLIQRSLKTIHEYIADEQTAAREQGALSYSSFLLNNAYGIQGSTIAHSFFNYNLLKKRIIMLNKNRSGKLARLKYLAALPLCAGMLCTSTLVFSKDFGLIDLAPRKEFKATADSRKDTVPGNINQLPPPPPSFRLKKPFQAFMTKKQSKTILAPPIVMPDNAPVPPPPPTSRPNKVPTPPPPPTVRPNKVPTPPTAMKPGNIKFPPPVVKPDKAPTPPVSSL